jgi:hypothetical protein
MIRAAGKTKQVNNTTLNTMPYKTRLFIITKNNAFRREKRREPSSGKYPFQGKTF